jgi:hypothetical protein
LSGRTENEGASDPWPVTLPGEDKPVRSDRVEEYVNDEFFYYYNFYTNCKHAGNPWNTGWLDWPPWTVQLMSVFDGIIDMQRRDSERKFLAHIHGYRTG